MIYGEECFSPLIKCQLCKSKLTEAIMLPCDQFCIKCVHELTKNADEETREFKCKSCNEIHTIPKNGFKSWEALNEFYSKELKLEDIYRGDTVERLKNNLKEIQKQIDHLDFSLANSVDAVKEHCLKLKTEVSLEAEIAIKQIQDIRDEMIKDIDTYQANCISHLESNKVKTQEFDGFINEMRSFHKKWSEYLKQYQINDSEITNVNNLALEMNKRYKKVKIEMKKLIFNKKSMSFRKEQIKIEKTFLGSFDFKTIGSIDINQLQVIYLTDILNKMNTSFNCDFDSFKNENIAIAYSDTSNLVSVAIIDKNRKVLNSSQTTLGARAHIPILIKTAKDALVIYSLSHGNTTLCLSVMNSNLEITKSATNIQYRIISLFVDEKNIYSLTNQTGYKTIIYDHQLNCLGNIGQCDNPQQPFYLTNDLTQIAYRNNKLYYLYSDKIDVLNETTGVLLKSITVQGSKMAFDSKSNLWVLSPTSSKLFVVDNLDGDLQDEIELENVPDELVFSIDQGDKMLFSNKAQICFYFN